MDYLTFKTPGAEYRGVALWMLNDRLEKKEILRQLRGFKEAGWGAVIGRTFNGLLTRYLGSQWLNITSSIIEQSHKQGTRMWLQAAYMPSGIPNLDFKYTLHGLNRMPLSESTGKNENLLCQHDGYTYFIQNLPEVLDLLNPEAVRAYLELAYTKPWYSKFHEYFGKTVEAIWVDEPHFRLPLLPWCERLPIIFEQRWGYDITKKIPALFTPENDYKQIRHHYWRLVSDMFLEAYFKQTYKWCEKYKIKFSGHLMGEDTICDQVGWTGACMPAYEYMQLPGIDHLTRSMYWPADKKFITTPKQVSSVANQLGKREVLCEMYGVSSQGITFAQRKYIFDWMAVLGINYRCYHGAFYSMRGRRKRIYAPHLSYQQPWWQDNPALADYCARLSVILRQGKGVANVLLLHNVESGFCLYDPTTRNRPHDRSTEPEDIRKLHTNLVCTCENLLANQISFDFGDETLIARHGKVTDNGLQIGKITYSVVILPLMHTIRATTLELLQKFSTRGYSVFTVSTLPQRIDGSIDKRADELKLISTPIDNSPAAVRDAITSVSSPQVTLLGARTKQIWVNLRETKNEIWLFILNNSSKQKADAILKIHRLGKLEVWDLSSGEYAPCPQSITDEYTTTRLHLPALGTRLFRLKFSDQTFSQPEKKFKTNKRIDLKSKWMLKRKNPNVLTLDYCRLRRETAEWSEFLPVIYQQKLLQDDNYKGMVSLKFTFSISSTLPNVALVIEDASEWEIEINGNKARYSNLPYYFDRSFNPVAITHLLRPGQNVLEITRDFVPVQKPGSCLSGLFEVLSGVELESVYIIGDFAVKGKESPHPHKQNCIRYSPAFCLTDETLQTNGNLAKTGYPFYAGSTILSQIITLKSAAKDERIILTLPGLDCVLMKVRLNECEMGKIMWSPYELDITDAVKAGENQLELEIVGSLRNLLGPHHRVSGEPDECWHYSFEYYPDANNDNDIDSNYFNQNKDERTWTHDYFCVNFGVQPGAFIKYIK